MNTLRALATTLAVILFAVAEGHAGTYRYELFHVDGMLGTFGYGINNDGVVVGGVSFGSNAIETSGFIRSAEGELTVVNYPGQLGTQVHGNNNLGQSIASYLHPNGAQLSFLIEADGSFTEMQRSQPADINDGLQVLGGPYNEIYLWDADGEIEWMAGGDYISAGGVNNRGLVVSSKEFQEDGFYRWRGRIHDTRSGETIAVDFPGAHNTFVTGINNLDQVIGTWQSKSRDAIDAFIRQADGTYEDIIPPGPGLFSPNDINDLGQIAGYFRPEGGSIVYGFVATPVPEPSSLALISMGIIAAVAWKRRKSA